MGGKAPHLTALIMFVSLPVVPPEDDSSLLRNNVSATIPAYPQNTKLKSNLFHGSLRYRRSDPT